MSELPMHESVWYPVRGYLERWPSRPAGVSALLLESNPACAVHVLDLPADEGFVYFDLAAIPAHLQEQSLGFQGSAETVKHEPCRLLSDSQSAVNLHAGDAILAVAEHPKSGHPLIHAQRRILEDRSDLERELLIASTAEPDAASLDEVVLVGITARTHNLATGPTKLHGVVETPLRVREVRNGLLKCLWRVHKQFIRRLFACVTYIFTT